MTKYTVVYIEGKWYLLNIDDQSDFLETMSYDIRNLLITFQTSDLIREFDSKGKHRLPHIIDLESFDKQMSQEGKEFKEGRNWKILKALRHHKIIDSKFELKLDNIEQFLSFVAQLYKKLLNNDAQERKRFFDVELKINRLIYKRQLAGVRVDLELAKEKCAELDLTIYKIKNDLQLNHNIFTPDSIELQRDYLKSKNYNIIQSELYTFKARRNEDIASSLFYELLRNTQDLNSLLYILSHWGGVERTYPSFFGFGTITSRITLRQPSLQNLRRSNRDVIVPDQGMKFLYVDYSQFEAGILASLSEDERMIELYNRDIYSDLAEKVLGDKTRRSDAKIIFYRYIYGDDTLNAQAKGYFRKFSSLDSFRKKIEKDIEENRKVGTVNGNFRYRGEGESSWALSHVIQSTASLIYKNALLRVNQEVGEARFLIPMHDATLYQVPEYSFEEVKDDVSNIFMEEFKKICPQIEPRVQFSEFADE